MRASDVIAACRDLGFVCRLRDGEYRLARPLSAYRHYLRGAAGAQECEAYYTDDPLDCVGTARLWRRNLDGDPIVQPKQVLLSGVRPCA